MTDDARTDVTVVIPVHNEADYLPTALPLLFDEMAQVDADVRVVIAENGSTDDTALLVKDAMADHPNLSLLELADTRLRRCHARRVPIRHHASGW